MTLILRSIFLKNFMEKNNYFLFYIILYIYYKMVSKLFLDTLLINALKTFLKPYFIKGFINVCP